MTTNRGMRLCAAVLASCLLLSAQAAEDRLMADKTAIEAAFLYNFAMFTDWPSLPEHEFNFCVVADNRLLDALTLLRSKQIKERQVVVRNIDEYKQLQTCQVVFLGSSAQASLKEINEQIGLAPVLLVSEEGAYDQEEVLITLSESESRIVFKINRTAAAKHSIVFSSKLLKLAARVY